MRECVRSSLPTMLPASWRCDRTGRELPRADLANTCYRWKYRTPTVGNEYRTPKTGGRSTEAVGGHGQRRRVWSQLFGWGWRNCEWVCGAVFCWGRCAVTIIVTKNRTQRILSSEILIEFNHLFFRCRAIFGVVDMGQFPNNVFLIKMIPVPHCFKFGCHLFGWGWRDCEWVCGAVFCWGRFAVSGTAHVREPSTERNILRRRLIVWQNRKCRFRAA